MPSGLFHGITTNPILAERAGLFYPSINWSSIMAVADELNLREFHVQVQAPMKRLLILPSNEKMMLKILI